MNEFDLRSVGGIYVEYKMMARIKHHLIILWLVATTAHLPFPVFDGDNVGSRSLPCESVGDAERFDVDYVFLGCDEPEDSDDGPVDDDPEGGEFSVNGFPVFIGAKTHLLIEKWDTSWNSQHDLIVARRSAVKSGLLAFQTAMESISPFAESSLGNCFVLRC